jgi:hypothetical protein
MAQDNRKKMKELVSTIKRQKGWEVTMRNGHYRVKAPSGQLIFLPSTPSDIRSISNARAELRRHGGQV